MKIVAIIMLGTYYVILGSAILDMVIPSRAEEIKERIIREHENDKKNK